MKILIICEYIAPIQAIASIRWSKIAKYIKRNHSNVQIDVLTNCKDEFFKTDSTLENERHCFDQYWEVPPTLLLRTYAEAKRRHHKKKVVYEERNSAATSYEKVGKSKLDFAHEIKDLLSYVQMKKGTKNLQGDYDVVISSYGPIWTHLVAEQVKKKFSHTIWLADFRDPYVKDRESDRLRTFHKKVTEKHCAIADYIVRVSDTLQTFTPSPVPVYTIPNGYDPEEALNPLPPKKFSIVFTGTLYGEHSDIGIIGKALSDLCAEGKIQREDVELEYAGSYGGTAKKLMQKYSAQEFLHDHGLISRQESLKMQASAAILILAGWNTKGERCHWTGKAYEYMMAEKPILYVVTGDVPYSVPSKQIHHLDGYCYEQCRHEETYQGMKDYILEKYQEWKATGNVTVQQDREYVEQYAYPHIAEQVWQLIQEGMSRRNENRTVKEN